ncbi:MAG: DUF4259 domain-containing protein [Chloroflexota bacterium]|nr:DUF4259 domain-containing protein [Chloroflexota bacterium]
MGAWGVNTFDNDTACDWKYELQDIDDLSLVRKTLTRVLAVGNEYLDSDAACEGLAACEVIARLKGNWGIRDAYTESLDQWVENHPIEPPTDLVNQALAAIDRVLTVPSELMELWDEGGENKEWHDAVEDLRSRVAT